MDFQDARYKIVTSWVVIVNCYIIHSVLEWAVCTTSINRWFIIVAKELYRHSVWVYQPGVLYIHGFPCTAVQNFVPFNGRVPWHARLYVWGIWPIYDGTIVRVHGGVHLRWLCHGPHTVTHTDHTIV